MSLAMIPLSMRVPMTSLASVKCVRLLGARQMRPIFALTRHQRTFSSHGHKHAANGVHMHTPPAPPSLLTNPLGWWRANNEVVKKMFKSYGWFAVATYLGVYVTTLTGIFGLVHAGAIAGPVDVGAVVDTWVVKKALLGDKPLNLPPAVSDFLFAWLLTKTTEPARLVVTIALVPMLVRRAPAPVLRLLRVPPDMWQPHFPRLRSRRVPAAAPTPGLQEWDASSQTHRQLAEIFARASTLSAHQLAHRYRVTRAASLHAKFLHGLRKAYTSGRRP